jgi:chromosome segregation ATPase
VPARGTGRFHRLYIKGGGSRGKNGFPRGSELKASDVHEGAFGSGRGLLEAGEQRGATSERLRPPSMSELDFALISRLQEVLDRRPATEAELRSLKEQADGWERALSGQVESSERRLRRLNANPASSLAQIASELRRVERLRPQLTEVRSLLADLEQRSRQLRTEWLLSQATSARTVTTRRPSGRRP